MKNQLNGYKKLLFVGIIVIALGITLSTSLTDQFGALGTVFIAIGGLLFIISMREKKKEEMNEPK